MQVKKKSCISNYTKVFAANCMKNKSHHLQYIPFFRSLHNINCKASLNIALLVMHHLVSVLSTTFSSGICNCIILYSVRL